MSLKLICPCCIRSKCTVVHFTLSLSQINRYHENHQQLFSIACCNNKENIVLSLVLLCIGVEKLAPAFLSCTLSFAPFLLHPFFYAFLYCTLSFAPFLLHPFFCTFSLAPFLIPLFPSQEDMRYQDLPIHFKLCL